MDFTMITQAAAQTFTLYNIALIFGGLLIGMVIGCIPGLSVTLGIILMLPLTYNMEDAASAIILMLAVYVGGMYGGSISAITLNTPGTNSAIATTFDGYPLARKGKVKKALDVSLFASTFGGLFSALLLLLCAQLITKAVSKFTSVEYFALGIMGISLIAGVSGESLPKALISGMLGLLMACIGKDSVTGVSRYAFGSNVLRYGINILPAMIALIALMQVVDKLREFRLSGGKIKDANKIDNDGMTGKEAKSILPACFKSSAIASILGAMPGVGGGVAQFMCYNEVRRSSKHPEEFGKGCLDGIAAAESSNNAVVGGSLVPLLTLGIPGNAVSAIFLGALTIQGLKPGPFLFQEQAPLIYSLFLSLGIAHFFFLFIGLAGVRIFPRILKISPTILSGGILILGTVGSFALRNEPFDIWVVLAFGLLGYFLKMIKTPTAPVVLGFILGPMIEANFEQAMLIGDGKWSFFFAKPISAAFIVLAVISFITPFILRYRKTRNAAALAEEANANEEEEL